MWPAGDDCYGRDGQLSWRWDCGGNISDAGDSGNAGNADNADDSNDSDDSDDAGDAGDADGGGNCSDGEVGSFKCFP